MKLQIVLVSEVLPTDRALVFGCCHFLLGVHLHLTPYSGDDFVAERAGTFKNNVEFLVDMPDFLIYSVQNVG